MSSLPTKLLRKPADQQGIVLITILVVAMILTFVGMSLADLTIGQYSRTRGNVYRTNALLVAEAGVERSLYQINNSSSFTGYSTEQEFFNNDDQGRGTYVTAITAGTSTNERVITSTGKVYRSNGKLEGERSVKVTIVGTTSQGYSVYTGVGGLILGGSANITNSEIFVNGKISLSGSARIGSQNQPLNVKVANQACPSGTNPGPTYPQVCTTGEPISLDWSTMIYGSVCATGQTSITNSPYNSPRIVGGNGGQGLIAGCTTAPVTMPSYPRTTQLSAIQTGSYTSGAGNSNTYVCNSWPFDRSWPAKLYLTGNVSVDGSCNVTINGNAHITGDLNIGGAATIKVADSVGTTRPIVTVDGKITVGGSARILANSSGTGIHFISYKSADTCGATCTNITGTALYNSKNLETINVGGAVNLPGMVFQAYWGKLKVAGSGNIGSALGQTVDLSGAGTITFGTTLSSGASTWTIRSYQQVFNN